MALANYVFTLVLANDANGNNVGKNVPVQIRTADIGSLITIYSDADGINTIDQSTSKTDSNGKFSFWAERGLYQAYVNGVKSDIIAVNGYIATETLNSALVNQRIEEITQEANSEIDALIDSGENLIQAAITGGLYTPVGDFGTEFTITERREVGYDGSVYWRWNGSLPKTVLAGDTPSAPDWTDVTQATLAADLVNPAVSGNRVARMPITAENLEDLPNCPLIDGRIYETHSFYRDGLYGGSQGKGGLNLYYDAGKVKTDHDGVLVFDPDRIIAWDGTKGDLATLRTAGTSGNGCLVLIDSSEINTYQLGITGFFDDHGAALQAAANAGVKRVFVAETSTAFDMGGNTVDLKGMIVEGNNVYTNGTMFNGVEKGIRRQDVQTFAPQEPSYTLTTSRSRQKILLKTAQSGGGHVSPNGENYSIFSPSSYGGIARFDLLNGVGGSGATDTGAPYDRLRVVNAYLYLNGYVIKQEPTSQGGGVTDSGTLNLNGFYAGSSSYDYSSTGNITTYAKAIPVTESVTYDVGDGLTKGNVALLTSAGSSDSFEIEVNGRVVKTGTAAAPDNRLLIVDIELDQFRANTIVVKNTAASGSLYCFGVNLFNAAEIPRSITGAQFFDKIALTDERAMLYSGSGASFDSVVVDSTGVNVGSYHGGDTDVGNGVVIKLTTGEGALSYIMNTSVTTATNLSVGDIRTSDNILIRNRMALTTTTSVNLWNTLDFSIDGGCEASFTYSVFGSDWEVNTLYSGMHSSNRELDLVNFVSLDSTTATNERIEFKPESCPMWQGDSANSTYAVYQPKQFDLSSTRSYSLQFWDAPPYIKFYHTPIQGQNQILKTGESYKFSCLYQYGKTFV